MFQIILALMLNSAWVFLSGRWSVTHCYERAFVMSVGFGAYKHVIELAMDSDRGLLDSGLEARR